MGSRPVSAQVMAELTKYVSELGVGQEKIFTDNFSHKRWKKIFTQDIWLYACSKWNFHCCYPETLGTLFTKSDKQGVYERRSCLAPRSRANTGW